MSYQALEQSAASGNPAELYQFSRAAAPVGSKIIFFDDFSGYANLAALDAVWVPSTSGDVTAFWRLDYPGLYEEATFGGSPGDAFIRRTITLTGLVPSHSYRVEFRFTMSPNATEPGPGFFDQLFDLTADGSGQLLLTSTVHSLNPPPSWVLWSELLSVGVTDLTGAFAPSLLNYTSADVPITYLGTTYQPAEIERGNFKSTPGGVSKSELEVAVDLGGPIAAWFSDGDLPLAPITCTIRRVHASDLTDNAVPALLLQVIRTRIVDKRVILTMAGVERITELRVPRVFNQRLDNNFLYDAVCRVDPAGFKFAGTVTAITNGGFVVTVAGAQAFADAKNGLADLTFYKDGVLIAADGTRGWIQGHAGDVMTLGAPIPGLIVGQSVTLQAGCDLTWRVCSQRFQNAKNRRAMDVIPNRNPFVGSGLL